MVGGRWLGGRGVRTRDWGRWTAVGMLVGRIRAWNLLRGMGVVLWGVDTLFV